MLKQQRMKEDGVLQYRNENHFYVITLLEGVLETLSPLCQATRGLCLSRILLDY
jgi:hypothetical protein